MTEFLGNMYSWFTFIPKITLSNLFEILILTVLIYEVLLWVKSTRAGVLLRGGMIIVGFYLLAAMFHLNTITWIINHMGQLVLTALIIIFQPELRRILERVGHTKLVSQSSSNPDDDPLENCIEKVSRAAGCSCSRASEIPVTRCSVSRNSSMQQVVTKQRRRKNTVNFHSASSPRRSRSRTAARLISAPPCSPGRVWFRW